MLSSTSCFQVRTSFRFAGYQRDSLRNGVSTTSMPAKRVTSSAGAVSRDLVGGVCARGIMQDEDDRERVALLWDDAQLFRMLLSWAQEQLDDEKAAVDMPLALPLHQIRANLDVALLSSPSHFGLQTKATGDERAGELSPDGISSFLSQHFKQAGDDLVPHAPCDFNGEPPSAFLARLSDLVVRDWAIEVHRLWPSLCFRSFSQVQLLSSEDSLLALPFPFIIPGDRFREAYYWDSYWIIRGLLVSGMLETATGVVLNLLHLARSFPFVPNGSRKYYTNRSQPPLLSEMVRLLVDHLPPAESLELIESALPVLLKEHTFWTSEPHVLAIRDRGGKVHRLSRYFAHWNRPRPESHCQDVRTIEGAAKSSGGQKKKTAQDMYREIATVAESGWDFSSRWMEEGASLSSCGATRVAPTDLNAFLFQMERNISHFARILICSYAPLPSPRSSAGCQEPQSDSRLNSLLHHYCGLYPDHASEPPLSVGELCGIEASFDGLADARKEGMEALMWHSGVGGIGGEWRDVWVGETEGSTNEGERRSEDVDRSEEVYRVDDRREEEHPSHVSYASNFVPLWCGLIGDGEKGKIDELAAAVEASGLLHEGGVAASTLDTGEQWDFPNAWPPLQHMMAEAFLRGGTPRSQALASIIASRFLKTSLAAYLTTGAMHEKYDVRTVGGVGGGGEYKPQIGFGWTNGAVLSLLDIFGWPIHPSA